MVFQGLQLLTSGSSTQFESTTNMTRLQMAFEVMIVMNVLSMMHWIVDHINAKMS
jgi:hypothetical protein